MKRYLNRTEKETVMIIAAFTTFLDAFIAKKSAIKTKPVLKWARSARTFGKKLLEEIIGGLDIEEQAKILNESAKLEIIARHKKEALKEHEAYMKLNDNVTLNREDFLDVIEGALIGACQVCEKTGQAACKLRGIFLKHDIAVLDAEAPEGKCPYQY